jgi:hypothetical protein
MPIISFPSSPSVNDTYSFNGKTWIYTGQAWNLATSGSINDIPIGNVTPATGNFTTVGATGNITTDQYFIGNGSQLSGITASGMLTVSNTAPVSPNSGDVWISANTGVQLVYFESGGNSQWAEMEADTSISIESGANIDLTAVSSNIIPSANITYDIGNTSNRFRDIYLANSTIYLGDAEISANGSNVVLASAVITSAVIASATLGNINNDSTGYISLPVGNTAQRPVAPTAGMMRFNTSTNSPEWYDPIGNQWLNLSQGPNYNVEYLVIAGGGGGGSGGGAGGGAGGYRTSAGTSGGGASAESQLTLAIGTAYTVTVGSGGAGGDNSGYNKGTNGSNSVFSTITSTGGGGGGAYQVAPNTGGSGGGAEANTQTGAAGTANQGYRGGNKTGGNFSGAGGGGAGATGTDSASSGGTTGGAGVASTITGSSVTRGGGGGGGAQGGYGGGSGAAGGSGGGGNGASTTAGDNGVANTGGGGGGGGYPNPGSLQAGGSGGSGVVIIRYLGAQRGSGGTITSADGYTIHTFTSSGTYTA